MNCLLVYPEFPDTFWSFKHALKFVGKRAALPPLGLLTVASMLPEEWNLRLVDTNTNRLKRADLEWADYVMISAMGVQRDSVMRILHRCREMSVPVIAGGPLFQDAEDERVSGVDHFILNEAEVTLPLFLEDFAKGVPRPMYSSSEFPDLRSVPVPKWGLLNFRRYASMCVQFSRGCPFNCDFCNVTTLFGHRVRTKTAAQIVSELESLYSFGWRGNIFFVDDNFIGNKRYLKAELLPALVSWRRDKSGIHFFTEASINLADDAELMSLMVEAGFNQVFIGIETPDEACLAECSKQQNRNRDLVEDVKTIHRAGLQVQGGFIVGFDHDEPSIFQRQIDFIQKSGIVTAMVGLLQAPPGTRLYARLRKEGRILGASSGDNVDGTTNIIPAMNLDVLREGYRQIIRHIYTPEHFYQRIRTFLREYQPPKGPRKLRMMHVRAFVQSMIRLGILDSERRHFWKLFWWVQFRHPKLIPEVLTLAIYGYHFRRVYEMHVK
jgi:radical SAM superfamily enzyme YgiQ (UPF0313 family)